MKFKLFIDESGDHGLINLDSGFPVFLLCGVIISENDYETVREKFNSIKSEFWGKKEVIFHSRDIRKCEKEFSILFNLEVKSRFYEKLNNCIKNCNYTIIAAAINKANYIKQYGKLSNDVYELSLSFIIERTIFYLDALKLPNTEIDIIIEKRGKKEDKRLDEHFQRLLSRGTGFVAPNRLTNYKMKINFKDKKENINGLQLADLVAYPIARKVIEPKRANPAYDLLENKIYSKGGKQYGLKKFP